MQDKKELQIELFGKNRTIQQRKLFTADGIDWIIRQIKQDVGDDCNDISTKEGRAAIKTLAAKVAKCKKPLEIISKELKEESQNTIQNINTEFKRYSFAIDQLRDQIRKPLDLIEAKEAKQIKDRKDRLELIERLSITRSFNNISDLECLIEDLDDAYNFDWGDFEFVAKTCYEKSKLYLESEIEKGIKQEADRLELKQLRDQAEKRAKKDYEDKLKKDAADNAKRESADRQKKLREQKAKAVADKKDAEARAVESERLRKEQEKLAEINRIAAEKQAIENTRIAATRAVEQEKARVEARRLADEAEAVKIAANKEHCAKIEKQSNNVIVKIIHFKIYGTNKSESRLSLDISEKIIQAIKDKKIPHLSINY